MNLREDNLEEVRATTYIGGDPHVITVVRRKPYVHSKAIKEVLAILDELLEDE
jgi:hypothetical protein